MKSTKQVNIIRHPDGRVQVEVDGVCGPECVDLTKELIDQLGIAEDSGEKPEFFETDKSMSENFDA